MRNNDYQYIITGSLGAFVVGLCVGGFFGLLKPVIAICEIVLIADLVCCFVKRGK